MDLEQQGKLQFNDVDDYLWLLLFGNKGGKLMKFILKSSIVKMLYNVHIYAMYEDSNCDFGFAKIFHGY